MMATPWVSQLAMPGTSMNVPLLDVSPIQSGLMSTPGGYRQRILPATGLGGDTYVDSGNACHEVIDYPYGLDDAEEAQIYLPGKPTSGTPAEFLDWVNRSYSWPGVSNTASAARPFAGIYNVNGKQGWSQSS